MPSFRLSEDDFRDGQIDILTILTRSGLSASRNEARRALEQGGVTVNDEKCADAHASFGKDDFSGGMIVRRGKKNYKKIEL